MDGSDEATLAWLTLVRTPGVGSMRMRRWLQAGDGDAARAVDLVCTAPGLHGVDPPALAWLRAPDRQVLARDQAWLAQPGHCLLRCGDADFPPLLDEAPGAPVALFVAGDAAHLLSPQLAVVGARHASLAGREHAVDFARALAASGLVITSGLAEGIDGAAHQAALAADGATVAVMGTGPDQVYPGRHRALAAAIAGHGALVSEFPPGTPPRRHHFPRRNRLIAGLSLGTLVIEASLRSGSLITARLAAEYGREVFALPGSIHHPLARGCHRLIRDGARLVETAAEVVGALAPLAATLGTRLAERLASDPAPADNAAGRHRGRLDADRRALLQALGHDPVSVDALVARTGLEAATLAPILLALELDGRLEPLPGGRYQRRG